METRDDNVPEKACKNGCGKQITWDKIQNAYIEVNTNRRHVCSNWRPNRKLTQEQSLYMDAVTPILLELRPIILEMRSSIRNIESYLMKKENGW
jgi:ribonuclease D